MALVAACPDANSDTSAGDGKDDGTKPSDKRGKGQKREAREGRGGRGGRGGKALDLGVIDAAPDKLFSGISAASARGFGEAINDTGAGVPVAGGAVVTDPFGGILKPGGEDAVEHVYAAFGSTFEASSEPVVAEDVIGAGKGLMVWRYVDVSPGEDGVQAQVGQIVILGGGSYETALVALSLESQQPVAISPPIQLQANGKVAKTDSGHRFVIRGGAALSKAAGGVVLAMVSSRGEGIHNGLPVAVAEVANSRITALKPVAEGYLSGRRFLSRGRTKVGARVATLLNFVAYDSTADCLSLEIVELVSKSGEKEATRLGGCAKVKGGQMRYTIDALCKVPDGGQERCKRVSGAKLEGGLAIRSDGIRFDNRDYALLPIDEGVKPPPPAPEARPQPPQPGPERPPPPDDGTRKSYSDR